MLEITSTTPKVQDVIRTSQARQSWSQETPEDPCLSSEGQSQESQSVRVSDLKVLCYVGNNLTTSKVQEVIRTSQARQSGPGKPLKTHAGVLRCNHRSPKVCGSCVMLEMRPRSLARM